MTESEARIHFSKALRLAARDVVVVTRRGKPVAVIERVTEDDIEDFLLERSETFWRMIEKARRGKSVPIDAVRKELGL